MAKIENQLPVNGGGNYIDRTSQLINDGEFGTSRYIELAELDGLVTDIVVTVMEPQYHSFSNQTEVHATHGLEKIPNVIVMEGEEEILADITHTPDRNTVIVKFSQPRTGIIIIQ